MTGRRRVAAFAGLGLVVGGVLAVVLRLVTSARAVGSLGWLHPSGVASGADRAPWLPTVPVALGAGLVVGLLLAAIDAGVRRGRDVPPRPRADVTLLAVSGLVLGVLVSAVLHAWPWNGAGTEIVYHGRYVALNDVTISHAYTSTLGITYDGTGQSWLLLISIGAGVGLVAGLLAAATMALRARRVSRS